MLHVSFTDRNRNTLRRYRVRETKDTPVVRSIRQAFKYLPVRSGRKHEPAVNKIAPRSLGLDDTVKKPKTVRF